MSRFTFESRYHSFRRVVRAEDRAILLARAEERAEELGLVFDWPDDLDPSPSESTEELQNVDWLGCTISTHDGEQLASLWGIGLPSPSFIRGVAQDPYIRVVEAELAIEAIGILEKRARIAALPNPGTAEGW